MFRVRRYTSKKLAKALMRRKLGSEISAMNRSKRAKQKTVQRELQNEGVLLSDVVKKIAPVDPYASQRKALHGKTDTALTKDGSVDCPACGASMGKPQRRGLFHKHFEYQCPNCHLVAEVKSVSDEEDFAKII